MAGKSAQNKGNNRKIRLPVLFVILLLFLLGVFVLAKGDLSKLSGTFSSVNKSDPDWLQKYCEEEIIKLPKPPFAYRVENKPDYGLPSSYLLADEYIPKDKESEAYTCRIVYEFDNEEAYSSMGAIYDIDIRNIRDFDEKVDNAYTKAILCPKTLGDPNAKCPSKNPEWKKFSISREKAGRPAYAYQGFPLVFVRENKKSGTKDVLDVSAGTDFYVKLTVYEK